MKDITFEARLIAATPKQSNNSFIKDTMAKITAQHTKKPGFTFWLTHLHKPALALLALVMVALISGAVYAAINFAPALIEILNKGTTSRGTTEYSVAGFKDCANDGLPATDKFEVNSYAPKVSDEDFKKIIQAKCELTWLEGFVKQTWKTYGTNPEWKDGDKIYYTRLDVMDTVESINSEGVKLKNYPDETASKHTYTGETLKAYFKGSEIPLADIKAGDSIFTVVRVSETYYDRSLHTSRSGYFTSDPANVLGLIAVFKMSLPMSYYTEMQNYITEVPKCFGNETEYCPNTGSIDVYPNGGEGSTNPYFKHNEDLTMKTISGAVTELSANRLSLKTRSGNTFTVNVGDNGFETYNKNWAPNYTSIDATLKIGSNVTVLYYEKASDSNKNISKEQMFRVSLLLESLNFKQEPVKQY